jgi:hypothetical protein
VCSLNEAEVGASGGRRRQRDVGAGKTAPAPASGRTEGRFDGPHFLYSG